MDNNVWCDATNTRKNVEKEAKIILEVSTYMAGEASIRKNITPHDIYFFSGGG